VWGHRHMRCFCIFVPLQIKAEKYLTPEQMEEEERKKLEEQKHLAAKVCRHNKWLFFVLQLLIVAIYHF